jgi:hypothetical protein
MKKLIILAIGMMAAVTVTAQTKTPVSHKKEVNQEMRIAHGVMNGELTSAETKYLVAKQNKIDRMQVRAKSDGVVTPRERRKINKEQNKASRAIRRQKHDAQDRK